MVFSYLFVITFDESKQVVQFKKDSNNPQVMYLKED